jgi:hypothetical protein
MKEERRGVQNTSGGPTGTIVIQTALKIFSPI